MTTQSIETRSDLSSMSTRKAYVSKNAKASILAQINQNNMDLENIIEMVEQELEIYQQERKNNRQPGIDPFASNSDVNVIDKKLMTELKLKELKRKMTIASKEKEQLEKKKRKLQNRVTIMPKAEEIRVIVDQIRVVQGEIETMKKEIGVKHKAIRYIKQGQDDLVSNDI